MNTTSCDGSPTVVLLRPFNIIPLDPKLIAIYTYRLENIFHRSPILRELVAMNLERKSWPLRQNSLRSLQHLILESFDINLDQRHRLDCELV